MSNTSKKIVILFFVMLLAFFIFLINMLYTIFSDKPYINPTYKYKKLADDGYIISSDGYILSQSKNLYGAYINTSSLNRNKIDLFVNLYSIYTKENKADIIKKIRSRKGFILLSNNLSLKSATQLKYLNKYLIKNGVFKSLKNRNNQNILYAITVIPYQSSKFYPYKDMFSNGIGYNKTILKDKIKRLYPVTGLEKRYYSTLVRKQDEIIVSKKNINGYLMYSKGTRVTNMQSGSSVIVSVNAKLQNSIEKLIDKYNKTINSNEIIVSIMDSHSGDIITLATTNRYNLNNIKQKDVNSGYINNNALVETYEPGSVTKPIILSEVLKKDKKLKITDLVDINKGYLKIKDVIVKDKIYYKYITVANVIAMSSNIGITKLSMNLSKKDIYNLYSKFGFGMKSGIDLPNEYHGKIKYYNKITDSDKVVMSFGYAFVVTFMQMLKAYNVFNNNGYIVDPSIGKYILKDNKKIKIEKNAPKKIISTRVNNLIRKTLYKTVKSGTAKNAYMKGLYIGGKTGTAKIVKNGKYIDMHNSSFFGFVNDKAGHKYTIGVLVKKSKNKKYELSSKSTIPLLKQIIKMMIKHDFLKI